VITAVAADPLQLFTELVGEPMIDVQGTGLAAAPLRP
jgi:hypothetical protein